MTMADAAPLVSATMNLVGLLVEKIQASAAMSEEQKKAALEVIYSELQSTADKVKNVKFDAFQKDV